MKRPPIHLTVETVKAIHTEVLAAHGGRQGLRDLVLLESAVAAPQATMGGQALFADPVDVASAYLFYLCKNHPFVDGNKRTALASCLVFLQQNDLLPVEEQDLDAWEAMVLAVAAGQINREETCRWLRQLLDIGR